MSENEFNKLIEALKRLKSNGDTYAILSRMPRDELKIHFDLAGICSTDYELLDRVLAVFEVFSE